MARTTRSARWRAAAAVAVVGLAGSAACTGGGGTAGGPGSTSPGGGPVALPNLELASALVPFDSCDALLDHLHTEALARVGPYGLPGSTSGVPDVATGGVVREGVATGPARAPATTAVPSSPTAGAPSPSPSAEDKTAASTGEAGGAPADPAFSGTNVHEAGVDEPDQVKTDGHRLVVLRDGRLRVVDVSGATPTLTGSVELPAGGESLLVAGDRALVVGGSSPTIADDRAEAGAVAAPRDGAVLTVVDLAAAGGPRVVQTTRIDGRYVDARLIGGTARVVVSSSPARLPFVYPTSVSAERTATEANRRIIESSTLDDWLPTYRTASDGATPSTQPGGDRLLDCAHLEHPKEFSGFDVLSVLTVDLTGAGVRPSDTVGVLADGSTVYASSSNLYVATPSYVEPVRPAGRSSTGSSTSGTAVPGTGVPGTGVPGTATPSPTVPPSTVPGTSIHKFSIAGLGPAAYRASGRVEGTPLNQYAFSEWQGDLRVAVTTDGAVTVPTPTAVPRGGVARPVPTRPGPRTETSVHVLREADGELRDIGSAGDMGRGERVRAVRFIGDRGYVVTFRQTDPLYTLDLHDPTSPRVAGELALLGYSAYLHPVGDGLLLGIGQDATAQGRTTGTKVALFDVHDAAAPRQLAVWQQRSSSTEVEVDPHAFLWWDATKLALLPVTGNGAVVPMPTCPPDADCATSSVATPSNAMVGLHVDAGAVTEVGRIAHPDGSVGRSGTGGTGGVSCDPACPPPTSRVLCDPACPTPPTTVVCKGDGVCPEPSPVPMPAWSPPIDRAVVIGDRVFTLSSAGVLASDVGTLAPQAWLPLT